MHIPEGYVTPLLAAAHTFLDVSGRDALIRTIERETATILGTPTAEVILATSRQTVADDLATALGVGGLVLGDEDGTGPGEPQNAMDFDGLVLEPEDTAGDIDDDVRAQLEPFVTATDAAGSEDDTPAGQALRDLRPGQASLGAALCAGGLFHGALVVGDELGVREFGAGERAVLSELAAFAAQALRLEEIVRDRESRDGLTGLMDQAFLRRELPGLLAGPDDVAVVMFDIDHFKKINDTSGHAAGDEVLRRISAFLTEMTRASDLVVRYGGEEFVIVLPGAGEDDAAGFAERLRQTIEAVPPADWAPHDRQVTISLGVAGYDSALDTDGAALVKRADEALYDAKRSGRNRVVRSSSMPS